MYPDAMRASIEDNRITWRSRPYPYHEMIFFLSASRSRVERIRQTGPCLCQYGPRTITISWISLRTSRLMSLIDSLALLLPPLVGRQPPKQKPSALVSCNIRQWVQDQSLPLWSSFPPIPSVYCMQQSISLSTAWRETRAHPLQF